VVKEVEVQTTRLDTFLQENDIDRIDFLHIDAQGHDLKVLRSLGERLPVVVAGQIEVPLNSAVALYQQQHSLEDTVQFLAESGFKITNRKDQ